MDDIFLYLYHTILTKKDILELPAVTAMQEKILQHQHSGSISAILHHLDQIHDAFMRQNDNDNVYQPLPVLETYLELICFFSGSHYSLKALKHKRVLSIGSHYGIEVAMLRMLGIDAYGIENEFPLFSFASSLFQANDTKKIFYYGDVLEDGPIYKEKFDIVLLRNANPLFDLATMIKKAPTLLASNGQAIMQWDGLYREKEAINLYSPKHGVYYHHNLRVLLDALYKDYFGRKKTRARFLYHMKNGYEA